ncbi:MAG: capsule polysaccharide biosynthesis protein, partial [bacterium]|nr:capsule polysaccharide biosynthesis protein [bacterium]
NQYWGDTIVLWDDSVINTGDVGTHIEQLAIRRALGKLPIRWYRLSTFAGDCPLDDAAITRAARADAVKGYRGEEWSAAQVAHAQRVAPRLRHVAGRIDAFVRSHQPRYMLVSTGYQSTGGLYPPIGQLRGVRVATTDGNAGSRLVAVDGVAAHLPEVKATWERIKPLEQWAIDIARRECDKRAAGRDRYGYQMVAAEAARAEAPVGALLPLNQSYDTSAMGRSQFFEGQRDWMMQTVRWLLEHTDAAVSVRQHPVERMYPGNDDYGQRLRDAFCDHPRLHFYDCNAQVNTYDLVARAQVILPHTSSVGMEAVAAGRPVVVEARSFYAEMGVVDPAPTKAAYFAQIAAALAGSVIVSDEQRRRAWACWYLSQYACYVPTVFTGYTEDFEKWSARSLEWLHGQNDVQLVLEAIDTGVPATYLRHLQLRQELAVAS